MIENLLTFGIIYIFINTIGIIATIQHSIEYTNFSWKLIIFIPYFIFTWWIYITFYDDYFEWL